MDEGDILLQDVWGVSEDDTAGKLFEKTGERGGKLLIQAIEGLENKTLTPRPQDHAQATYTKMIEKSDAQLQPDWTVDEAYHAWQAYTPTPGLYTFFGETRVVLLEITKEKENIKSPPSP